MKRNDVQPILPAYPLTTHTNRIFLTTLRIPDENIWANGLFQNVFILYKMFEGMGYEPWLLVDNKDTNKEGKLHTQYRIIDFTTYIEQPFPITAYMEIAMSCDPSIRAYFKQKGAKITKTYLGNILNIDIETVAFYRGVNFAHHVTGQTDEIFVSPHYDIHEEYAGSINGIFGHTRIAPYVWDPVFVQNVTRYKDEGFHPDSPRNFLIMEPNISFQKMALLPILAVEAYFRKYPERVKTVLVVNGDKLRENPYFMESIAPNLTILQKGILQLMPRANIVNIAKIFQNAIVLQHQVNNSYNYSTLEWLYLGFPLIHNIESFKTYGYYYEGNDFLAATEQISFLVHNHNANLYATQAKQLFWQFSIHNPNNLKTWEKLVFPDTEPRSAPSNVP